MKLPKVAWIDLFVLGLAFLIIGCGGGGGGDTDTSGSGTLRSSHQQAVPGRFITLEDASIAGDTRPEVTFSDTNGYAVTLTPLADADGSVSLAVPFYFDGETGYPEAGTVTISLPNGKQTDFQILALPDLADFEPGDILMSYLTALADNLEDVLTGLDDFEATYDHDVTDLEAQLRLEIEAIEDTLAELETTGSFSVSYLLSGTTVLTPTDLRIVEQLLYAMISGVADALDASADGDTGTPEEEEEEEIEIVIASLQDLPRPWREGLGKGIRDTGKKIGEGHSSLLNPLKKLTEEAGPAAEIPGHENWSNGLGWLAGLLDMVTKGVTNEMANKVEAEVDDAYQPGQGFKDAAVEKLNETIDGMTPKWVERLGTLIDKLWAARRAKIKQKCAQEPLSEELAKECLDWQVHPEVFASIGSANFIPDEVVSGQPVTLAYRINGWVGNRHAEVTTVTIDWDTEDPESGIDQFSFNSGYPNTSAFGGKEAAHIYELPGYADKTYIAQIRVVGDNDPDEAHAHTFNAAVRVKSDIAPLTVSFLQAEGLLEIDEPGSWRVAVDGGVSPFDTVIRWGDGRSQSRSDSHLRRYQGPHSYEAADEYTIRFHVTDARGFTAFDETRVEVVTGYDDWDDGHDGDGDTCQPPTTAAGEAGAYFRVKHRYYPMPDYSSCYTPDQIAAYEADGMHSIHPDEERGPCTVCPDGYSLETIDGAESCYACPDGTNIDEGCCL
jgi:hypothetical protein